MANVIDIYHGIGEFYQRFLSCEVSRQFAAGNPRYLVGMYYPLHEADLSKFAAAANGIIERNIQ